MEGARIPASSAIPPVRRTPLRLRFLSPLIEPSVRISRTGLSFEIRRSPTRSCSVRPLRRSRPLCGQPAGNRTSSRTPPRASDPATDTAAVPHAHALPTAAQRRSFFTEVLQSVSVPPRTAPIATRWNEQRAGGPTPAGTRCLSTANEIALSSASDQIFTQLKGSWWTDAPERAEARLWDRRTADLLRSRGAANQSVSFEDWGQETRST